MNIPLDVLRFESRTRASVKNLHVFPFIAKFGVLAHRIEMLLTIVDNDEGSDARESTTEHSDNPVSDKLQFACLRIFTALLQSD